FRAAVENAALRRHVLKRAIAAIVKKPAGLAAIRFRRAIRFVLAVEAAKYIVISGPLHIVADEKIEQPVAVVIEPQRGGAEAFASRQPAHMRHVRERTLAGIFEKMILSDAGYENVSEAVVVVIADGDSHAIHFNVEARGMRDVGK